jgi:proline dehydrogenase
MSKAASVPPAFNALRSHLSLSYSKSATTQLPVDAAGSFQLVCKRPIFRSHPHHNAEPAPLQQHHEESMTVNTTTTTSMTPQNHHQPLNVPSSLNFNSGKDAFSQRSFSDLLRSYLVFKACQVRPLVTYADTLLAWSRTILGSNITNFMIKETFYKQFIAGADGDDIQPRLAFLRRNGIHPILDYAAEDDVSSEQGPASREPEVQDVVARTYEYEGEATCDQRTDIFLKAISAAAVSGSDGKGFAAIKLTALGPPKLLERVSTALLAIKDLFRQFDSDGNGYVTQEEFAEVYSRFFSDGRDQARVAAEYDLLDERHDNNVDYAEWTKRFSLKDAAILAQRCLEQGPFNRAALTERELNRVDAMMARLNKIADAAAASGVRLMIDAEHSYFQPAIDHATTQLQERHNRTVPTIFNTYQCYLTDAHERMALDLERARNGGYKWAAKLVRGAYMVLERRRAEDMGYTSPILPTIEATHASYEGAVQLALDAVCSQSAEVMIATHNQASVEQAVTLMAQKGLSPDSPIYFGQLLGMSDNLTFTLGRHGYYAYKYVPYGSIQDVVPYLLRRAQENSTVMDNVQRDVDLIKDELASRLWIGGRKEVTSSSSSH